MMNLFRSKAAFEEARNYMPGGVNSPVRSYPHMDLSLIHISEPTRH